MESMDDPKVSGPTLPARFTRFFGREAEIDEVEGLLARARVVTLTGAPGCGKTRLSTGASPTGRSCA